MDSNGFYREILVGNDFCIFEKLLASCNGETLCITFLAGRNGDNSVL